jgi:hypothetical protein
MSIIDKNNLSTFGIGAALFIAIPLFIIVMIYVFPTRNSSKKASISTSSSKYVSAKSAKSSNYGTPKSRASLNTRQYEGSKMLDDLEGELEAELRFGGRVNKKSFLNFKNIFLLLIGIILGYIIEKSQKLI